MLLVQWSAVQCESVRSSSFVLYRRGFLHVGELTLGGAVAHGGFVLEIGYMLHGANFCK